MPAKRPTPRAEARGPAPLGTAIWLGLATTGGVGPILLHRKGRDEYGLGDLVWLAGGMPVWVFDAAALARGEARGLNWAIPLGTQAMGLSVLAVALAAWRSGLARPTWSWTNVTGWVLGLFWVTLAITSLGPIRLIGLAGRW